AKFINYSAKDNVNNINYRSAINDYENNIWVASFGEGLLKIIKNKSFPDKFEVQNYTKEEGLNSNYLISLFQDREHNLWIGTYGAGVSKLTKQTYRIYKRRNGLKDNFIWNVKEDHEGNIWTTTNTGGIAVLPFNQRNKVSQEFITFTSKDGLLHNQVETVFIDSRGNIWIGSTDGLTKIHFNKRDNSIRILLTLTTRDGLTVNEIKTIYEDSKGNMWIGTYNGVSRLKPNKIHSKGFEIENYNRMNGLVNNRVYSIVEDNEENIWIATGEGVSRLERNKNNELAFKNFTAENGLANDNARTILRDKKGWIWIGTGGGISIYKPKTNNFDHISTKDGLTSDRLYLMHFDDKDHFLWIGTNIGIDRFDLAEFYNSGKKKIKHFTHLDGFLELETNTNAVCQDRFGNLWFGTIDGLIKYNPKYIKPKNELEPILNIKKVTLAQNDSLIPRNAVLPYFDNYLTFQYVGISLTLPDKVRYSFKLNGFDNAWSPMTNKTEAIYSNLPPGEYSFEVLACNNDGIWNKYPASFDFTINPPFWKTIWFYLLTVSLTVSILYLLFKWRVRKLKLEKKVLERKVFERTRELKIEKEKVEVQNIRLKDAYEVIKVSKEHVDEANEGLLAQKRRLEKAFQQIRFQKDIVDQKNKDITDSIHYAQRIQSAILIPKDEIFKSLSDAFVLYKPKDIVSGDFYWYSQINQNGNILNIIAACDCTGHGVPGALMSMIGNELLNQIVTEKSIAKPSEILTYLHLGIKSALRQEMAGVSAMDGMDIAICAIEQSTTKLQYAGANRPLYLFKNGELDIIKPDKNGIGGEIEIKRNFTNHELQLQSGNSFYIFSDGYVDQFGGPKIKKYKSRQLREKLCSIQKLKMHDQGKELDREITLWQNNLPQTDDILVIGVRI
ncbi:SpoIIE family protein phosphatase, partial [Bacteroidales bacterium AH-315-N07]|nr:SpoIIE family protein phosphatase [Bacteroidales bacterium AH-315-N07]